MASNLVVYLNYSEHSHVITSERLKEELTSFRVEVLKKEFRAVWNPRLKKIKEGKGWLLRKEHLDRLLTRLEEHGLKIEYHLVENEKALITQAVLSTGAYDDCVEEIPVTHPVKLIKEKFPDGSTFPVIVLPESYPVPKEYAVDREDLPTLQTQPSHLGIDEWMKDATDDWAVLRSQICTPPNTPVDPSISGQ